jgi:hypothetical protein
MLLSQSQSVWIRCYHTTNTRHLSVSANKNVISILFESKITRHKIITFTWRDAFSSFKNYHQDSLIISVGVTLNIMALNIYS